MEISCIEVLRELSNYVDEEVSSTLRARIESHVQQCPGCKAMIDGVRNVIQLVGSGEVIELPQGFSQRLFKKLALAE
jgi:predicted anti-sigma-YlaC factor YlaD